MGKEEYLKLNKSFNKRMIFRLGYDAGFFSEYNNLILAAVYCIHHKIEICINSGFANFKKENGWGDIFLPFFSEDSNWYNKLHNFRPYLKRSGWKENVIKNLYGIDFFTQDLWNEFRCPEFWKSTISLPGERVDFLTACHELVRISYQFQPQLESEINSRVQSLCLPHSYLGLHIRRGDKKNETGISYSVKQYLEKADSIGLFKDVFIATDDYNAISEIKSLRKDWNIYHLNLDVNSGYSQKYFDSLSQQVKFDQLKNLFTEVEILNKSHHFLGSNLTNIAMFVGMWRNDKNCYYLENEKWTVR